MINCYHCTPSVLARVSAVEAQHRVVEAPIKIFEEQNDLKAAFDAGDLDRDVIVVVRFQGPKANGMPELHKLTSPLGVIQDRGYKVTTICNKAIEEHRPTATDTESTMTAQEFRDAFF